jgi:hypothetical protein
MNLRIRMRRPVRSAAVWGFALGLSVWALAGCGRDPLGVEASCVAAVNVDGILMTTSGEVVPPDSVSAAYVIVERNTGCLDQGQPHEPLGPGASNFLAEGTSIHRTLGYPTRERLTYRDDIGEWRTLIPIPWAAP